MKKITEQILENAIFAPSGDNSQPWEFICQDLKIQIKNLPQKDNKIFNFEQRGSYIAHGALLENITQLAKLHGHEAKITFFPDSSNKNITAEVKLIPSSLKPESEILRLIRERNTNRKKYQSIPLTPEQKQKILVAVGSQKKLLFCEDEASKHLLAQSVSITERIMLEYKPLHEAFFSMIRWSEKEEQQKHGGLNIKTLELLPPQKLIFKWFSHWNASAILRRVGLPKFIALENSKIYSSCSAICALVMESEAPKDFLQTGMELQRIWLTATKLGLSMQPIAGVLYLYQRLVTSGLPNLPENQKKLIITAVENIQHTFNNPTGVITMMFRIGQSNPPSARSIKFPPKITYQNS
jgi:nitroreductase